MKRQELIEKAAHEYINSDAVPAWNEQLAFGDFINGCHWADEHPDIYSVTRKAIAREREYMIKKTAEFLWNCGYIDTLVVDEVINSYKKAMEEQ